MKPIENGPLGSLSNPTIISVSHNPILEAARGYNRQGYPVTPVKDRSKIACLEGWQANQQTEATLEAVLRYHGRGWAVTPVRYKDKAPYLPDWPKRRLEESELRESFSGGPKNIGIVLGKLSGGLVDIDLDCTGAVSLAPYLLPPTDCIFGRASNPASHYVYRVPDPAERKAFTAGSMGTIAEYRGKGSQTVFPGSVHPSGEVIEFVKDGDPGETDSSTLLKAIAKLAAGSLLVPNWIEKQRHNTALALGGTLARSDWPLEEAKGFVEAICTVAGDTELSDRLKAVESAYEAVRTGQPAYGLPELARLVSDDTVNRIKPWLGLKGSELTSPNPTAVSITPLAPSAWEQAPLSDSTNAHWFAQNFRDRARYSYQHETWFLWNGTNWKQDASEQVTRLAQMAILGLTEIAVELSTGKQREVVAWVKQSLNQGRLQAMLRLAQPLCEIQAQEFDVDPWLLNFRNGTLDLRRGELRPHSQADLITKCLEIDYRPDAQCPIFKGFLSQITANDQDLMDYLQRVFGYSITGSTQEQCMFILHGDGANGKSTLVDTMKTISGPYAETAQAETFMSRKYEGIRSDLARLDGYRMVICEESEMHQSMAEGLVKQATSGDTMVARRLYKAEIAFKPRFKLFIATNRLPKIEGQDEGIWRRLKRIPFNVTIPEEERDQRLPKRLLEESEGILAWMVDGCLKWQAEGLRPPAAVQQATADYREESDIAAQFISECCERVPDARIGKTELYSSFREWCQANGQQPLILNVFGGRLKKLKVEETRTARGRVWKGLQLLLPEERAIRSLQFDDTASVA
jgi:putative DNA primase/helicase